MIPSPRTAAEADGWVGRPAPPRDLVYVDGSALSRFLEGAPERAAWGQFVAGRQGDLVTSVLGVTELKRVAQLLGRPARDQADAATEQVDVVRFSDQALKAASRVSAVLPPFVALHLGAALAHPDVRTVATYDTDLARVCVLHGLVVVSPGWPDRWWERVG
ncbi:type II toxin-antitoxin system VapC family toxin [Cellulomonas sp. SG140]|uniref:type II toxin-antitoxin system VapC family toxin n=1 Tax=Cellulomonas sp. SG140 TaxID=2976536 RepID=UPI0021E8D17E|nr:PIN domain-containing protein [Cellulomonas sp. SG140]